MSVGESKSQAVLSSACASFDMPRLVLVAAKITPPLVLLKQKGADEIGSL